ncbi:MAG: squalene/phytoene synthase family protein [Acidobacteriota bacterium]|jgi:farnesyl-diphosphate farnesyltransferase
MVEQDRLDDLLEKTSRTFALSIPVLPQPTRLEVTVAYLMFRIADTLEDATRWGRDRQLEELEAFAGLLRDPSPEGADDLAARWVAHPPVHHEGYLELLRETPLVLRTTMGLGPEASELIRTHTLRTIERMASFVARARESSGVELEDTEDLRAYCYAVAGIVGEMLTELFLLGRRELAAVAPALRQDAAPFGEALQLVNILKDSADDSEEGRRFLPPGCDRAAVFALAREDLDVASRYVGRLQRAGAPRGVIEFTALPVLLAWRTLDRVEEEGPGAKLTRPEVVRIVASLQKALSDGAPAIPGAAGAAGA